MNLVASSMLMGAGATALVDAWSLARRRLMGSPLPDYGLVGRWIAWLPRGRFHHARISQTPAVRGEQLIGWTAHYAIGIGFAALLLAITGSAWASEPTPLPALLFGIATVAAPFLVMQPGMGQGFAASKTSRPGAARLQSLITHATFGMGLYVTATLLSVLHA